MKGEVDGSGRAILRISESNGVSNTTQTIEAWVDTGFTGDLVVPRSIIESLGLEPSGAIDGVLADGTQTILETYHCEIDAVWKSLQSGSHCKFRRDVVAWCWIVASKGAQD